jgi:hypothetical protein
MSLCPKCGATLRSQAQFCSVCGERLGGSAQPALSSGNAPGATILMPGPPALPVTAVFLTVSDGQRIPAQSGMTIGRDPNDNVLCIADGRMSRRHAMLQEKNGQWFLADLNSANGTFVNNRPITAPTLLNPGDQIQMGDTTLSLQIPGQQQPQVWGNPPMPGPVIPGVPDVFVPYGGWKNWQKAPLAEGRVEHIDRHTMKRDDLMQRGCMAVILGLIAAPLAFLPFMQGSDLNVLNIRVADAHDHKMVDVKVMGDLYGVISQGDTIAVWGNAQKGLFVMQRAYNYTTGHEIAVRK